MELADLVRAVLDADMLAAREWVKEARRQGVQLRDQREPSGLDDTAKALAAGLAEHLAGQWGQAPPDWTRRVGPAPAELWLVQSARRHPALESRCRQEGPEPLRSRGFFAFPSFLATV